MRSKLAIFFIAASFAANAAPSAEELCTVEPASGFEVAVAGINKFLSSSNPAVRHSGAADKPIEVDQRVRHLPALDGVVKKNPSRPIPTTKVIFSDTEVSEPTRAIGVKPTTESTIPSAFVKQKDDVVTPSVEETIKLRQRTQAKLSPKTETLFNVIPSGVGSKKSVPQQITLDKGNFVIPQLENDPIGNDGFEEITTEEDLEIEETSIQLDITVSDVQPDKGQHELHVIALKALSVGQYESAIAVYKKILRKDSKDREALFGVATAYHKAGERKKARNAYGKLLKHYPKFEDGINNFISLASSEAPEHALEELKALQKSSPDFPPIYAQKGLIYSKLGDKKQAIKNMAYALKLDPTNHNYRYNLAILLDEVGKYEYAAQLYRELVHASYRGEDVPVGRRNLEERMAHIVASIKK